MHSEQQVKELVRKYIEAACTSKSTRSMADQLVQLMSASNIDIRDAFIDEMACPNQLERLFAAQQFLLHFRHDPRESSAIEVFENALKSTSTTVHISAFSLLYAVQDVPRALTVLIRKHMGKNGEATVAAATIAICFEELRPVSFRILGDALGDETLSIEARLLVALRLIRLNYATEKAWRVVDQLKPENDENFQFATGCLEALIGLASNADPETASRILDTGSELLRLNHDGVIHVTTLLGNIQGDLIKIDKFLLEAIDSGKTELIYSATTALSKRGSPLSSTAEQRIWPLLQSPELKLREVAALCLLRCFHRLSSEAIKVVAQRVKSERDLEVMDLLIRICEKAGVKALQHLFDEWKEPTNLRGWIQTMILGRLGETSHQELFKVVADRPGVESSRLLSLLLMGARLTSPEIMNSLLESLRSGNLTEQRTLLVALQNGNSDASFLAPELIKLATRTGDTTVMDLAARAIQSIGPASLTYFPDQEHSSDAVLKLRRLVESSIQAGSSHILEGAKLSDVKRFAAVARLLVDQQCRSIKGAALHLTETFPNEKGWSENSIKRSFRSIEQFFQGKWSREVKLVKRNNVRASTKPSQISAEGERILASAEQFLRMNSENV